MEFALIIWLISSLSSIAHFLGWFAFLCALCVVVALVASAEAVASENEKLKVNSLFWVKFFTVIALVSSFVATILPSTKTGWMMAGAYTAQTALQSESAKKVGGYC
jgi:hypothetical protein